MGVLLTGGAGYIGRHTAAALAAAGRHAVLLDNFSQADESVAGRLEMIIGQRVTLLRGDVRDTELLARILQKQRIDAVIHFAGLKSVEESGRMPLDYYANNVQGSISLLQAMHAGGVRKLVFSSSASVYGSPCFLPVTEDHPTLPASVYGRTKLVVEQMLRDAAAADSALGILCLRYFNPAGGHPSGLLGEQAGNEAGNLFPALLGVAAGVRERLTIYGSDYATVDGTGVRDYVHVLDVAEGHVAALDFLEQTVGWDVVNLGSGRGFSVLETVRAFERAAGIPIPLRFAPRRSGDVGACYAGTEKAERLLHWKAARGLETVCRDACRGRDSIGQDK